MIVSFSVKNFGGFAQEQTLLCTANKDLPYSSAEHLRPIPGSDQEGLRVVAIYGATDASRMIAVLEIMRRILLETTDCYHFMGCTDATNPSEFDLIFVAGPYTYRLGLEMGVSGKIAHESLELLLPSDSETIYDYSDLFNQEARRKRSFLSVPRLGDLSEEAQMHRKNAYRWFEGLAIISSEDLETRLNGDLSHTSAVLMDGFGRGRHPVDARRMLHAWERSTAAQLILATTETYLMEAGILRRDEIWFEDDQGDGTVRLYPLTDFLGVEDPKTDVCSKYLSGRYGAIPILQK